MDITDSVYGKVRIESPVLLDLIHSAPVQRLKKISQFGLPDEYYHLKNYSRYDHCVGVMLLLKNLGASEEEQVAGLLHDVSHTAFSHVVDWVVGEGKTEDFQDNHHTAYIQASVIPEILKEHTLSTERVVAYHHFGLLERDLPDLCADRVDYSLREFPEGVAADCVADLHVFDKRIVFTKPEIAVLFARYFLQRQMEHWGGFEAVSRYRIFAAVLKHALQKKIITMKDFWEYDAYVIEKLLSADDKHINDRMKILQKKSLSNLPKSNEIAYKKFRYVDPLIQMNNKLTRLSEINQDYKIELEEARAENDKGIHIPRV